VSVGSTVWVFPEAFPQDTLIGTVEFIGAAVSPSNRTFPVEIDVPNPDQRLKPEMIARVRIVRSVRSDALLINQDVAQLVDRERMIVYVENNGKAEERRVTIGGRRGNMVEILDGLNAGDRLIVAGFKKLVNGQPVVVE
jgi:membrane fusion protein (multidrug efflux system)